jgi:hypothetical protein
MFATRYDSIILPWYCIVLAFGQVAVTGTPTKQLSSGLAKRGFETPSHAPETCVSSSLVPVRGDPLSDGSGLHSPTVGKENHGAHSTHAASRWNSSSSALMGRSGGWSRTRRWSWKPMFVAPILSRFCRRPHPSRWHARSPLMSLFALVLSVGCAPHGPSPVTSLVGYKKNYVVLLSRGG